MIIYDETEKELVIPNGLGNIGTIGAYQDGYEAGYAKGYADGKAEGGNGND